LLSYELDEHNTCQVASRQENTSKITLPQVTTKLDKTHQLLSLDAAAVETSTSENCTLFSGFYAVLLRLRSRRERRVRRPWIDSPFTCSL
jgi:hypothetical protein